MLEQLRSEIDAIDDKLIELLTRRLECAIRARRFKQETLDSGREKAILARLKSGVRGVFRQEFLESIFSTIFKESRTLQDGNYPLVGVVGTEAALLCADPTAVPIPYSELGEVFAALERKEIDQAVVSAESNEQRLRRLFLSTKVCITAEQYFGDDATRYFHLQVGAKLEGPKTAVYVVTTDRSGELNSLLSDLAGVNLTKISSIRLKEERVAFFIEFDTPLPNLEKILNKLATNRVEVRNLGSFGIVG